MRRRHRHAHGDTPDAPQPTTAQSTPQVLAATYAESPRVSCVPLIIGHRGASAVAPENTLAAFERALLDGADGLEFDVRLARDGVPVVIHDATLRRTAGVDGSIATLSSTELAAIDVGSWFNRRFPAHARAAYARETVPTLARVFETVAPRCRRLYVELKCEGRGGAAPRAGEVAPLVAQVVALVRAHKLESRVVIESFAVVAGSVAHAIAPEIETAAAFERRAARPLLSVPTILKRAHTAQANELALHHSLVSPRMVEAARGAGLRTVVWTVDDPSWIARAATLGLSAVITNDPAGMRRASDEFSHETVALDELS